MSKDGEEKKDPTKIIANSKYSKNYGTEDQPDYKGLPLLFYSLLKKYDTAAIQYIEDRVRSLDPPRLQPKAVGRNSERKGRASENKNFFQEAELRI